MHSVPLGTEVDSSYDQIIGQRPDPKGIPSHCRCARVDRQTGWISGKEKRWPAGHTGAVARMETTDGFNRWLVLGKSAMKLMGNKKVVWELGVKAPRLPDFGFLCRVVFVDIVDPLVQSADLLVQFLRTFHRFAMHCA